MERAYFIYMRIRTGSAHHGHTAGTTAIATAGHPHRTAPPRHREPRIWTAPDGNGTGTGRATATATATGGNHHNSHYFNNMNTILKYLTY